VKSGTTQKIAISSGSATGLLIDKVAPVYPSIARAARVQGTVILRATISKTGDIAYLEVISGDPLLRSGVMDAVRRWKYKPYLVNGEPVAVDTTINVVFHLDDSGAPAANGIGSANQVHLPAANSPGKLINAPPEYANSAANANPAATAFNLSSRYAIAGPDDAQTVLDTKTGLMWMRKDYRNIEGKFAFNWDDATAWPSKINTQSYGGYSDWRVPTITQYRTINNSKSDRMIYATIFAKTEAEDYWSSNTPGPYTASYISFQLKDGGYAVSGDRKMPVQYSDGSQMRMSVRLVRLVRIARKEAK
jgi:TonB family protein